MISHMNCKENTVRWRLDAGFPMKVTLIGIGCEKALGELGPNQTYICGFMDRESNTMCLRRGCLRLLALWMKAGATIFEFKQAAASRHIPSGELTQGRGSTRKVTPNRYWR